MPKITPKSKGYGKDGNGGRSVNSYKSEAQIDVEDRYNRRLTQRQKRFAELFVEGQYSNRNCAIQAGYAESSAHVVANYLLNPKEYPHVVEYIAELQEERERKYGVTLQGQLKRLYQLSRGAEDAGQYSAAINAEKIRSALGGLTIDRRETVNTIDDMTRDQIVQRLADLQSKYPQAFAVIEGQYKDVTDGQGTGSKPVDLIEAEPAAEDPSDED